MRREKVTVSYINGRWVISGPTVFRETYTPPAPRPEPKPAPKEKSE